jgi:hypothetical protein
MRFRVTLAVAAVGVASLAPHAVALPSSQSISVVDLGQGAAEAWIYLPEGAPECAVVFLHGAGDLTPGPYRAWLSYLAIGKRCAVIYPRYQASAAASALSTASLRGLRAGVAASFTYLRKARFGLYRDPIPKRFPVVVAGFASGGVLALYAAANAKRWGVPVPVAVDSIFPVDGRIPGVPLTPLAAGTRVLIQAGDRDKAGGRAAAKSLWQSLASHPAGTKRLQVVQSTAGFAAVHNAPLQATTTAASIFWDPLDTFIDAATGG